MELQLHRNSHLDHCPKSKTRHLLKGNRAEPYHGIDWDIVHTHILYWIVVLLEPNIEYFHFQIQYYFDLLKVRALKWAPISGNGQELFQIPKRSTLYTIGPSSLLKI